MRLAATVGINSEPFEPDSLVISIQSFCQELPRLSPHIAINLFATVRQGLPDLI
jgi:hypothetical protein